MIGAGCRIAGRYDLVDRAGPTVGPWEAWVATDVKFDEQVLLRVASGAEASERLRAAWAARMAHRAARVKGVLRVLDWGEADGLVFQALDLLPGAHPLDLARGSTRERLGRLADAAEIVVGLHRQGVAHLDLGPSRFLVAPDGVHLSTFESARCPEEGAAPPLRAPGERRFAAPERLTPGLAVDDEARARAMDAFSVGAMLHVAVLRTLPGEPAPEPIDVALLPLVDLARRATATAPAARPSVPDLLAALRRGPAPARGATRSLPALPTCGFIAWDDLRRAANRFSADAVVEALGRRPLLLVRKERPLDGRARYLGRGITVRPSKGPSVAAAGVVLGRAPDVDLPLELPTISSRHLLLTQGAGGWTLADTSSNGTTLGGKQLHRDAPTPLADGDLIGLADHVWLQFVLPASLSALLAPDAAPIGFEVHEAGRG